MCDRTKPAPNPFRILVATVLVLGLLIVEAPSAAGANAGGRLALVIGNSNYSRLSHLKNARNDAILMADTLKELGFEVTLLKDADAKTMTAAVFDFGDKLALRENGAAVVFYYSGHGTEDQGNSFLLPVDFEVRNTSIGTRVPLQDVLDEAKRGSFDAKIIIVDACRKDDALGENRLTFSNRFKLPSDTLLAFSTGSSAPAVDGAGKNSPYTDSLTKAMRTPGLEIAEVLRETAKDVSRRTNDVQQPQQTGSLKNAFYFIEGDRTARPVDFRREERKQWDKIRLSNRPSDFRKFLDDFPDGEYADIARKRYQRLETFSSEDASKRQWSKYGVNLVYVTSLKGDIELTVAGVTSGSLFGGKLFEHDVVLQINYKAIPEGQDPNRYLDEVFDKNRRVDLLVRRGASVYTVSSRK